MTLNLSDVSPPKTFSQPTPQHATCTCKTVEHQVYTVRNVTVTPNTYLALTIFLFIILTLLAPETLVFMIPALILSIMSHRANNDCQYVRAKRLATGALVLNFTAIFVAFVAILAVTIVLYNIRPWQTSKYGCYSINYTHVEGSGGGKYLIVCQ